MDKFIELHRHLDGSVSVDIARKLQALSGVELPEDDDTLRKMLQVPEDCGSLNEFLQCFDLPGALMQTPESLSEAVRLVLEEAAAEGVIYAEIRFAPQLHLLKGMDQEAAVRAALAGLRRSPIPANLIICFMRGEGNESANLESLELAKKYLVEDGGVVALDIAGAEGLFPTAKYRELFEKAREYGIPFTIHAGEADGPESVRLAAEYGARRIGHGVRMGEDPELVKLVGERGIALEMCPTSNRMTHAVEDMSGYPLRDYLKAGIRVTLNTDDPAIEGTVMGREFAYMEELLGVNEEEERIMLGNAVEAAFTSETRKEELRKALNL